MMRVKQRTIAIVSVVTLAGCFTHPTQFHKYIAAGQWTDAAREFAADSTLRNSDFAMYEAGLLFGTPGRPTYDPPKGRDVFATLVAAFPESKYRDEATGRMLLLDDMIHTRQTAAQREQELEGRIAALTRETRDLRARIDSMATASDSLRASMQRLEADRREKEEQVRALRSELQKLKEIDLKPRTPTRPIKP